MNLSSKLIVLMTAGVIILVTSVSFLVFIFTRNSLQQAIQSQQLGLVQQTMDKIDRFMEERYKDIETVSTDKVISAILIQHLDKNVIIPEKANTDLTKRMEELSISTG